MPFFKLMTGEFNDLTFNNLNVTFSPDTNNIETSDELNVGPVYQYETDTNYAKRKRTAKALTIAGLSVAFTATLVSTGAILTNIFITNPPKLENVSYVVDEKGFEYSFTITNDSKYKVYYYLKLDNEKVLEEDCSTNGDYAGVYTDVKDGQSLEFIIEFTNSFDYIKAISNYQTIVERN